MNHYYIYYRVSESQVAETELQVRSMQARLSCQTGIHGCLLKKRDDALLWMEVYENVKNSAIFETALARLTDQFEIDILLDGEARKMECFEGEATFSQVQKACQA